VIIGGEELHNNHHTYPTSAKLSVKPYEFDIGWLYIRILETLGWAKVKQDATSPGTGRGAVLADEQDARRADRQPLRSDGPVRQGELRGTPVSSELDKVKARRPAAQSARQAQLRWHVAGCIATTTRCRRASSPRWPRHVEQSPSLAKMVAMREELRQLWTRTNVSRGATRQPICRHGAAARKTAALPLCAISRCACEQLTPDGVGGGPHPACCASLA
jgi:stearoyl-CoA desaturase (delta-9 desaturase)